MGEPIFNSSLSGDEIEKNFENTDLFTSIVDGLNDVLACENNSDNIETNKKI